MMLRTAVCQKAHLGMKIEKNQAHSFSRYQVMFVR